MVNFGFLNKYKKKLSKNIEHVAFFYYYHFSTPLDRKPYNQAGDGRTDVNCMDQPPHELKATGFY